MRRLLRVSKGRPEASASALRTSAAVPASGFTFVDNSQGASAAAAELSTALGAALDKLDLDGDLDEQLRCLVHQLDQEASKYDNSTVNDEGAHRNWECSQATAQLVSAAWKCALGTYDLTSDIPNTEYCLFQRDHVITPSIGGSVKAMTSTIVQPATGSEARNDFLPALVIAIRGSASKMDHMVNANGQPKDAKHFIGPGLSSNPDFLAHSGFLNSAKALGDAVLQRIHNYIKNTVNGTRHICSPVTLLAEPWPLYFFFTICRHRFRLFHTIFLYYLLERLLRSLRPIELPRYQLPGSSAICLNIINEFDLVGRADRPYILSLVNLFRSMYGQPSLPLDSETGPKLASWYHTPPVAREPDLPTATDLPTGPEEESLPLAGKTWPVSRLYYHHVGPRVIFLMRLKQDQVQLTAVEIPSLVFEKFLFCRIAVHRRVCYSERIQLVESGRFNNQNGWEADQLGVPDTPAANAQS